MLSWWRGDRVTCMEECKALLSTSSTDNCLPWWACDWLQLCFFFTLDMLLFFNRQWQNSVTSKLDALFTAVFLYSWPKSVFLFQMMMLGSPWSCELISFSTCIWVCVPVVRHSAAAAASATAASAASAASAATFPRSVAFTQGQLEHLGHLYARCRRFKECQGTSWQILSFSPSLPLSLTHTHTGTHALCICPQCCQCTPAQ